MEAALIFPHQLFAIHPAIQKSRMIYLIEEKLFFRQYKFHKQKLVLHRASMKMYETHLKKENYPVTYIETIDKNNDIRTLIASLAKKAVTHIHYVAVSDNWLDKRIQKQCLQESIGITQYPNPNFLNSLEEVTTFFDDQKKYFQTDFTLTSVRNEKYYWNQIINRWVENGVMTPPTG